MHRIHAFSFYQNELEEVTIHNPNSKIYRDAFAENQDVSTDLIIRGHDPSTAKDYAIEHQHTFKPITSNATMGLLDGNNILGPRFTAVLKNFFGNNSNSESSTIENSSGDDLGILGPVRSIFGSLLEKNPSNSGSLGSGSSSSSSSSDGSSTNSDGGDLGPIGDILGGIIGSSSGSSGSDSGVSGSDPNHNQDGSTKSDSDESNHSSQGEHRSNNDNVDENGDGAEENNLSETLDGVDMITQDAEDDEKKGISKTVIIILIVLFIGFIIFAGIIAIGAILYFMKKKKDQEVKANSNQTTL